jgi:hypothetical protein
MKDAARLIIPVWGERYVGNALSVTLPAVLASGNLPALCEAFDVELAIVTERRLFATVTNSRCFQTATKICAVRLIALDDLLTETPGDYGMVLTYALFRGFADLGPRVTETYLLFLNADFIISDGSLRHLGTLMKQGHSVVHAPSFRVVLEDILPLLKAKVDVASCTLRVPSRELVKLALAHKHPTVKARTVNQRLRHQFWMDQYYWYVDEGTLIGYQSPAALVAIKPQRVVTEPAGFWDYSFIPEAAPLAVPAFITDSDDFFMIESQSRGTGSEMIRIGWFSLAEMARKESVRATQEHRYSGRQLLKIHAGELPPDIDGFAAQSRIYMNDLYRLLSPAPAGYIGHPILAEWFAEAKERRRGVAEQPAGPGSVDPSGAPAVQVPPRSTRSLLGALRAIYRKAFGFPPQVSRFHPLWVDMAPICRKVATWRAAGLDSILSVGSDGRLLDRLLRDRVTPAALLAPDQARSPLERAPYDACICHLSLDELLDLETLYASIRPLMKNNGSIVVCMAKNRNPFDRADVLLARAAMPDIDVSRIHFFGTVPTALLAMFYAKRIPQPFARYPLWRLLSVNIAVAFMAPVVWLVNALAARRDDSIVPRAWTSLMIEFTVRRRVHRAGLGESQDRAESQSTL